MHKVKVTKAEAALWGIEHLAKVQKKEKDISKKGKEHVKGAASKAMKAVTKDNGDKAWKKEILEGRKEAPDETAQDSDVAKEKPHAEDPPKKEEAAAEALGQDGAAKTPTTARPPAIPMRESFTTDDPIDRKEDDVKVPDAHPQQAEMDARSPEEAKPTEDGKQIGHAPEQVNPEEAQDAEHE
ncbi:hypothetical protein BD626DRAFT_137867 [Schizophyllum amplum]|uniref:Uncharacterized protein n=1 Tax=Schizophyllum amplum TaxID=97359 RepID=A0A550C623_9AGAR|nr:hypothetical protein BD626DRAFT_137867 [Auriculariopsis ampla]